ncbi:MAG: ATP-binding protein [Bryobacteraceae bacterium]
MPTLTATVNPFPGLRPFDSVDSEFFFGRGQEIDELINRLGAKRFLAVLGVSGCGKSSLVYAGLIPILVSGLAGPLAGDWDIYTMWPGDDPLGALETAIGAKLPGKSHSLLAWAREQKTDRKILIFVDQFEEIFAYREKTLPQDGGSKAALFIDTLLMAVSDASVPVYLVLTMRTDFLGEASVFRGLSEALNEGSYLVPRLSRLRQQDAIERPAAAFDSKFHPRLVQELLNESEGDPDKLPILQHLLRVLWEARDDAGELSIELYRSVGGWQHAIEQDAEKILVRYPEEPAGIKAMFQWLSAPGAAGKPIRRRVPFSELPKISGLSPDRAKAILNDFAERGFVRFHSGKEQLVDFMHESVMWQWPKLQQWIAEEAEDAAEVRFLQQATKQRQGLTGFTLENALEVKQRSIASPMWISRYISPTEEVDDLLGWINSSAASVEAAARLSRRGRQTFVALVSLLCIVLAIAGGISFYAYKTSEEKATELDALTKQLNTYQGQLNASLLATNKDRQKSVPAQLARELVTALNSPRINVTQVGGAGSSGSAGGAKHGKESIWVGAPTVQNSLSVPTKDTPSPATLAMRANITIEYFAKQSELKANPTLVPWWQRLGFKVQIKTANFEVPSNKVWYGSQVDVQSVQAVGFCLLGDGFALRQISPLSESNLDKGREHVIQVGWSAQADSLPLLTPGDIQMFTIQ